MYATFSSALVKFPSAETQAFLLPRVPLSPSLSPTRGPSVLMGSQLSASAGKSPLPPLKLVQDQETFPCRGRGPSRRPPSGAPSSRGRGKRRGSCGPGGALMGEACLLAAARSWPGAGPEPAPSRNAGGSGRFTSVPGGLPGFPPPALWAARLFLSRGPTSPSLRQLEAFPWTAGFGYFPLAVWALQKASRSYRG